ncbi:MAG: PIG-L family deacetylase [Deltaproteobacteria bacterium]|nr:PIG-L family deacetylase [Deltaproteobacteria bacterium]
MKPKNVLCLGAHCDDIEIGCGGTILQYAQGSSGMKVHWVVFSSDERREKEAIESADDFLKDVEDKTVSILRFRNGFFPQYWGEIKEYFEELKEKFVPDVIFTHCRGDLHQDHRVIHELTWNTFRNHLILEYEIAKYDADLRSPNAFVCLEENICRRKTDNLKKHFKSQADKPWFTDDLFMSMLRLRGVESNSPSKYAEGFYCRKIIL